MKSPKRKSPARGIWGNARALAVSFSAPAVVIYTVFMILPIFVSLYISLQKWDGANAMSFVGLGNFIGLVKDAEFWVTFKNTIVLLAISVALQIPIALFHSPYQSSLVFILLYYFDFQILKVSCVYLLCLMVC
jgi:ABC-type sugar transport system permease subunit